MSTEENKMIQPFVIVGEDINLDPSKGLINPLAVTKEFQEEKKPFEEKLYLILYIYTDDDGAEEKSFQFIKGRSAVYDFIKSMAPVMNMYDSMILVENLTMDKIISVYDFVKHIKAFMPEDSFDIDDYVRGDDVDLPSVPLNSEALDVWNGVMNTNNSYEDTTKETKYEVNEEGEYLV